MPNVTEGPRQGDKFSFREKDNLIDGLCECGPDCTPSRRAAEPPDESMPGRIRLRGHADACSAGAAQTGRRRVKVVPWPSRLSARRRPRWASTMSRQTERPRPVPPRPESSGPVLVVKKGSKIRRRSAGAIPTPVSATLTSASAGARLVRDPDLDRPAARHRLAGVDEQVQEHLLDLRGVDPGMGAAGDLEVELDPVPRQVLAHQQDDLLGQSDQVGRLAAVGLGAGQAEHAAGDRRGPLGALEDLLEGPLAVLGVGVAQAELGIVQDRRQRVVQLVADPAGQHPQAADPLQRDQLAAEGLDLVTSPPTARVSCDEEAIVALETRTAATIRSTPTPSYRPAAASRDEPARRSARSPREAGCVPGVTARSGEAELDQRQTSGGT